MDELICPACRSKIERIDALELACTSCSRHYPLVAGVPDLRLAPDPYLSMDEDRAKARELAAVKGGLRDLLQAYWDLTPEVPSALAERYIDRALDAVRRAEVYLGRIEATGSRLLDVGCGTGGMLVAAAARGAQPVGVDIALRWLVVASRRLADAGVEASLVAADGAVLPFPSGSFDTVTCIETLEHARDKRGLLNSCLNAAAPSGQAYLVTSNRFSVLPEPSVGLWGLGFLPRRVAAVYVRRRCQTSYEHFRAISRGELGSLIGPDARAHVAPAPVPPPPPGASAARRAFGAAYEVLLRQPAARRLLGHFGPYLEVRSRLKPDNL